MSYNGHKNWNHWNVSLWVYNEETIYRMMCEIIARSKTLDEAAREILHHLPERTPDGAPYSFSSVRAAIRNWEC